MRTKWRGLRMAVDFLAEYEPTDKRYAPRRAALQGINFTIGVATVLDGCNAGKEQLYIDLIEGWHD